MTFRNWGLSLLLMFVTTASARADGFSDLIIFSGSLSDTGNLATLVGDSPAPFWNNRSTNGPAAVDVFAERLGFDAEPSLHLIGEVGGNNFAVRGATTGGDGIIDLPAQLDAYFQRTGGVADPDALYFMFIGGHDVIQAVLEPDIRESRRIIVDAVEGFEVALHRLLDAGARHIYAPGFINVGTAPGFRQAGLADKARELSLMFEMKFNWMLRKVEFERKTYFYKFSFYEFVDQNIASGEYLGFTNKTDSCVDSPDCDLDKFIFMDSTFPSARVHDLLGNALALDLFHQIKTCRSGNWHRTSCVQPFRRRVVD